MHSTSTAPSTTAPLETFGLSRRNGALYMEGVSLADIAKQYGTPTFVYSRAALSNAFAKLNNAVSRARQTRPHTICFAVKANSNLAVLNV